MSILGSVKLWTACCVAPYSILSLMVYSLRFTPRLQEVTSGITPFIWLAGPPALLGIDLRTSWLPFVIGSVIVLAGMLGTIHWMRRREPGAYICGVLVACTWICSGVLALILTF
jgi:NADH:ubiquinone oxidoreductase subunit 6 (subunit J)